MANQLPMPQYDPIALRRRWDLFPRPQVKDPQEGLIHPKWVEYMSSLAGSVNDAAVRVALVTLTDQDASIGATALNAGDLRGGLYQVKWYARITQAATTNSSLTVTIAWTETGVSLSYSGSAMTGNTTGTVQVNDGVLVRIDHATPLTYATTYASTGATAMEYRLDLVLTEVAV